MIFLCVADVFSIRGGDAHEPSGPGEHVWDGAAVPAFVLEVEEEHTERGGWEGRRCCSGRLEDENVGRAAVVEENAVVREFVAGAPEGLEEGVGERLLEYTARDVEELAQGRSRDILHENEVGPTVCRMGEPHDTVEDRGSRYAYFRDAQMQGDL